MKIISWNVNGIRSCMNKGFLDFFRSSDADIFCLQETKVHNEDLTDEIKNIGLEKNYTSYWNGAKKKGYSGTAIISKIKPINIEFGIGVEKFDKEGRVIIFEMDQFYLVNVYVLNSKRDLDRLNERIEFNRLFIEKCEELRKKKPVIFCGDLNVAHKEIDLKNPKNNIKNAGFTIEEREEFSNQLDKGYIDIFREFNSEGENYTWWSYMHDSRKRNIGWRIDYFIISKEIKKEIKNSKILSQVKGSDHCPIELEI